MFGGNKIRQSDIKPINDYINALKRGSKAPEAFKQHMLGCSVVAKRYVADARKAGKSTDEMIEGLKKMPKASTAASAGLKALSVAGNMLVTMGISVVISLVIERIQKLVHAQEEAIKKADEFIDKFNEQRNALTTNEKNIDSISEDYEKLSKGVDSLGRNVSLNTEEYSRYNEIVNQIAEMFPQMVQGYTDEGNAIIAHKGNVEALTAAYEKQKQAAQEAIIVGSADVFKGFKAAVDNQPLTALGKPGLSQMKDVVDKLVATGGDIDKIEALKQSYANDYKKTTTWRAALNKAGLDGGFLGNQQFSSEYIRDHLATIQALSNTLNTEIDTQAAKIKPIMQAYLEQSKEYKGLDEDVQDIVKQIIGQFDTEFFEQFDDETQMASWVTNNIVNKLGGADGKEIVSEFQLMFKTQTKFNDGKITVNEYQEAVSRFLNLIKPLPDETEKYIKLVFGISTDEKGNTHNDIDTMVARVKAKLGNKFNDEIGTLKVSELKFLNGLDISSEEIKEWSDVLAMIDETSKKSNASLNTLNQKLAASKQELVDEFQKASDWGLDDYLTDIMDGTVQSTFGNVDMNKRQIITWNDELKETYKDALKSWNYDPEIGTIDTVFGASDRFGEDLNGEGFEIAFTPILPDGTFLSEETVSDYFDNILWEALRDDKVTEDELKKLDEKGKKIGGVLIHGIFAGMDEEGNGWADTVGKLMHFSGKYGSTGIIKDSIADTEKQIQELGILAEKLDNIQSAYDKVKSAMKEYNEQGYLSVDTFQELASLEPEYFVRFLTDENGNIKLNTEAMYAYTDAIIDNMAYKQIDGILDYVEGLDKEQRELYLTKQATEEATDALANYAAVAIQTRFAEGELSEGGSEVLQTMLNTVTSWAKQTKEGNRRGGLGKSDKSGSSKKDNTEKLAEAWKKEHLETLKDGLEEQKDILDRYKKDIDTFDFGLKIVEENDFSTKADLLTDKLDKLTAYGKAMRDEFNRISKITPQTADEAKELASRIETLGSDMRSNVETLRQTYIELQKLRTNMASMFIKEQGEELKSVLSTIDKRIEILKSEYKDEYGYVGNMLSFSSLLPSYSEEDKKLREKRRSDRELIKEEQETQDKINEIITRSLQMQAEENRKAREKERQEYSEHLNEERKEYSKHWNEVQRTTSEGIKETVDIVKNNPLKIEVDTSAVDKAVEEIKKKWRDLIETPEPNPNTGAFFGATNLEGIGGRVLKNHTDITSKFGGRYFNNKYENHTGVDYAAFAGTPIYSYAKGTVVKAVYSNTGYGNHVIIDHGNGYQTLYGHASALYVKNGDKVELGQAIAAVGSTGKSTGNHLHFELRENNKAINPEGRIFDPATAKYANGTPAGNAMAGSLGIAGENYKPEILIDKATGETTYIDTPTVIDTKKTDVVGEKATARLPKFEDGTVQDVEDRLIAEEKTIQDIYDKLIDETSRLQRSFILRLHNIENDQTVDDFTKTQNLYKARYDYSTEVTKIGNELYENLSANLLKWLEDVEGGSAEWSKEVFDEYKDTLGDIRDFTVSMVDEAVKSIQEKADDRWKLSEDYINERNQYNDWRLFDDSEIEAWERVVEWLRADFPKETKRIRDAEHSLYEAREKEFKKATDLADTYLNSQKTLLQAHYDVVNSVAEAQHDINKELETSKTMYEWLNEDTRKLLFNQEDYNRLNRELNKIQRTANNLQAQYEYDLKNATLEDIEKITSEYEMQYKTLMKSYEIAKADLEIARKKQKLNNVLNERNVRMFINGSWQQVANTEDVITARQELADAEYARRVEASGLVQQRSIDDLTKQQNKLNVTIKNFDNGIISLKEAVDTAAGALKTVPTAMKEMLQNAGVDTGAITSGSTSHSYGGVWYDTETNYMELIRNASTEAEVSEYNTKRNAKIRGEALKSSDIKILTYGDALNEWKKARGYATGTRHTFGGLTKLGEKGFEAYISPNGSLTPITSPMIGNITGGGVVFNTEQLKNLRTLWDWSNIKPSDNKDLFDGVKSQQIDQSQDNRIIINGMTVDTGSSDGQALVNALRRYVGNH